MRLVHGVWIQESILPRGHDVHPFSTSVSVSFANLGVYLVLPFFPVVLPGSGRGCFTGRLSQLVRQPAIMPWIRSSFFSMKTFIFFVAAGLQPWSTRFLEGAPKAIRVRGPVASTWLTSEAKK